MKVVYLCAGHAPFDKRIHYKICPILINRGYAVATVHPNIANSKDSGIKLLGYVQKEGYHGRLMSLLTLYRTGRDQNADVIIAPEPDSLVVAYIIKRLGKKVSVVFDCHEWYNLHFLNVVGMKNKIFAMSLGWLVGLTISYISKRIEAIITVNDTMTDFFGKYNSNTHTIPSLAEYSLTASVHPLERRNFIFFGNFCFAFQALVLLDAARALKRESSDAKIVVIGGYGEDEVSEHQELLSLIEKEELQDNIQLTGWLPKEEAFAYLSTGLAGIMRFDTALYKGAPVLPNKTFEYMSMGLALICCELNTELTKVVLENRCGVTVRTETGLDLAGAILYLHKNRQECISMGENAYEAVQKKYNWEIYGARLGSIMQALEAK